LNKEIEMELAKAIRNVFVLAALFLFTIRIDNFIMDNFSDGKKPLVFICLLLLFISIIIEGLRMVCLTGTAKNNPRTE
jgi:ABC-type bacteriocin/lantibiotic exporter with double-glycine peptidase domain